MNEQLVKNLILFACQQSNSQAKRNIITNLKKEVQTMITAAEARKIADSKAKSEHNSPLFKYAIDQIERSVRDISSRGGRSFSCNICVLAPGYKRPPDLPVRKALGEELRKNGFSYCETQRSPNCVWFEVSW